ncbi:MAG TPA: hypothetical protein VJ793_05535 [Anaerolineae bacterium]|nr:hypothetical protein [Anaerolineae bacterium]
MASDGEVESLNRQLHNLRANLYLIDERISEFVEPSKVPLQYVRDKRKVEERCEEASTDASRNG